MDLSGLVGDLRRIRRLRLEGLHITVSSRRGEDEGGETVGTSPAKPSVTPFVIEEIIADGTRLDIRRRDPQKAPLTFDIDRLNLHSVGVNRPLRFRATLTNPQPPGLIESTGEFGPWRSDEPGLTPVSGRYTFENADLSTLKGIAGILSSTGQYRGVLERIEVEGATDTPDFSVSTGGHTVHLQTQFNAIVDGTKGDTFLQPVNAQFLHTRLVARGEVVELPDRQGKMIRLDVSVSDGRVEDLLRLAVKSDKPSIIGALRFNTKFELPPGKQEVVDRLRLKGAFKLAAARFTNLDVQEKVTTLSRRARGETDEDDSERIASNMKGLFNLRDGVLTFSDLSFRVPGASVHLDGTYALRAEAMDFRGTLHMQAKLSQTTTGIKSFLLKAVDPLFKKEGAGAILPIKITGTRQDPSFDLEIGRAFKRTR